MVISLTGNPLECWLHYSALNVDSQRCQQSEGFQLNRSPGSLNHVTGGPTVIIQMLPQMRPRLNMDTSFEGFSAALEPGPREPLCTPLGPVSARALSSVVALLVLRAGPTAAPPRPRTAR